MSKKNSFKDNTQNSYDDDNIPEEDLPQDDWETEPLPETTRPRKDGPGGENNKSK